MYQINQNLSQYQFFAKHDTNASNELEKKKSNNDIEKPIYWPPSLTTWKAGTSLVLFSWQKNANIVTFAKLEALTLKTQAQPFYFHFTSH